MRTETMEFMASHARGLIEPDLPIRQRIQTVMEIKDKIEMVHTADYLNYLKCYFGALVTILMEMTTPQFTDNEENKLRHNVLDILNRLPHNEVLRPLAIDLFKVVSRVLVIENENNGLLCVSTIIDLLRNFKPALEDEVKPVLDFVCKIYQNFGTTVKCVFKDGAIPVDGECSVGWDEEESGVSREDVQKLEWDPGLMIALESITFGRINPSWHSFKIISECPVLVIIALQVYGQYVQTHVPVLFPFMLAAISIAGPENVPPQLKGHFYDLKGAQVKTVSFLTYLLRSFGHNIRRHEEGICKSVVNLLVTCPDSFSIRKELLVALKRLAATEFKRGLLPLIDTLLEERILVGTGHACVETLRPLAYSLIAELLHPIRGDLSLSQLSQIVYLFSSILHDASLSLGIQITSARLLLNLVESILEKGVDPHSMDEARVLLGKTLDAFVEKFSAFNRLIHQEVLNPQVPVEHSKEVNDTKILIKTLVMGMKTIIWSITHVHSPQPQVLPSAHAVHPRLQVSAFSNVPVPLPQGFIGMKEDEVAKISIILKRGVQCLAFFKEEDEEKEMINLFCQTLAVMEPQNLIDMFSLRMPELFEWMIRNKQLVCVFSVLLGIPKVLRPFANLMVNYLLSSKIDDLRHPNIPSAKLVLQLFQLLFDAVSKTTESEHILQPHIHFIISVCVKNATEGDKLLGYLKLLQITFQTLKQGNFEHLLRDLIPKLQLCLDMLLAVLDVPIGDDMKGLVLELCLTLPARLSSLLPHLPRLMKPLVLNLKGSTNMVKLGLETLEFWIDNLNPNFLESCMRDDMSEVILALWTHVRPAPYPMGKKALVLLGKLGGRNRCFFKEPRALECKKYPEHGLRMILTFEPMTTFLVPLDQCVSLAVSAVLKKSEGTDVFYRKQALKFLHVCLSSQLNLRGNVPGEEVTPGVLAAHLVSSVEDTCWHWTQTSDEKADLGVKTKTHLMAERSIFKILLMTIIAASAEPDLQDSQDDFVVNVCHHFAMIFHVYSSSFDSSSANGQHSLILSSSRTITSRSRSTSCFNLKDLDPFIFLDAIVDVLADQNRLHAKAALNVLNVFAETLIFLAWIRRTPVLSSRDGPGAPKMVSTPSSLGPICLPPPSVRVPVFEQLLPRLLHCCYGSTWQAQIGGVMGLGALVTKITVDTLCFFQERLVRGLVYVLRRLPMHASKEQEETSKVFIQVLRLIINADEANSESRRQSFQAIVNILAAELFNVNASIVLRKNVQFGLELLASRTGSEVSELLEPLYQPLLQPLIMRSLRSKNIDQQIGTVSSLSYCLALRPHLLKLTREFINLLQEAERIAGAAVDTVCFGKFMNEKMETAIVKLRVACFKLLNSALAHPEFKTTNYLEFQSHIISTFFKSLTSDKPEIVAVAKEGIWQVIQQQRLSKDLLMSCIRPTLVGLSNPRNLSMPLLQNLSCLLEIIPSSFSVNLGDKLLENLKKLIEPDQCKKPWKVGEEPKIAEAIIELFHKLPPKAERFLDDLVTITIGLEVALPHGQYYSEINSPYRLPLTKFLNRFATKAVDHFLGRLNQPTYFRRFMHIIRSDAGQPLREELAKSPRKLLASAFPRFFLKFEGSLTSAAAVEECPSIDSHFNGLFLISVLIKLMPNWLHTHRVVFDTLVLLWKSPDRTVRLHMERELSLMQVKESKWLIKCFLNYVRHDSTEVDILFEMLSIFLVRTRIDFTFLKEFYYIEVAETYPPNLKKLLLLHFLKLFQLKKLSQYHLVVSMQMLILPMLSHAFQNGQAREVVDPGIIKTIAENFLEPPGEITAEYSETLRIELLQLSSLLIKHLKNDLLHVRKEIIKFSWSLLKLEDSVCKRWAYITVCYFFEAYQVPEKIITQVFVSLLRSCQPENKMLVKKALDLLMPILPQKFPLWIRCIKKVLAEDGHSIPSLVHIFQIIIQYSDLFYRFRGQFVPQMVNALCRLGLPHNTTTENRCVAIRLAGLVVGWERQRQTEIKVIPERDGYDPKSPLDGTTFPDDINQEVKMDLAFQSDYIMSPGASSIPKVETPTPGSAGQPDEEFRPNAAMREMIINFLIRVAMITGTNDKEATSAYKRALDTLSQALEVWPTANVKFNHLEKLLSNLQPSQSKDPTSALSHGLDVMNKVLEKQPHLFIQNNINQISQVLGSCFSNKMLDAGKATCSMLKMIFTAFPVEATDTPQDVKFFYQRVENLIQKHLAAVISPQVSEVSKTNYMTNFVVVLIKTLMGVQHNFIDPFIMPLSRILLNLARDISSSHRIDADSVVSSSRAVADMELMNSNLKDILKLISERSMVFPECKRYLDQILSTILSEKGIDASVQFCILDVIQRWIDYDLSKPATSRSSSVITYREIVSYLQKLSQVDKQSFSSNSLEEWDRNYLQLLYGFCANSNKHPRSVRQEVFEKVERQFMPGLRAKNPDTRQKFFSLYDESLEKSLFSRLQFIIQVHDWEALSDVFWLKHGLDLLLATLVESLPISLAPNSARIRLLVASASLPDCSGLLQQRLTSVSEESEVSLKFNSLVLKHAQFLNKMNKLQVCDLIAPFRELAHSDANVAYDMWILVFPIVWIALLKEEQLALAKPLVSLLSKDFHKKQQAKRPNVIQALLEGIHLCHPQPRMPSELIKYLGKTFNAWHISLALLESHVPVFVNDTKCSESLSELYRLLNEEDMRCGLWKKRSTTAETSAGLSLVQQGYWQHAQNVFYQAMVKATQGTYSNMIPKTEMCLWEERWLSSASQLGQWDALVDFGKSVENYEILLDCLWKTDWTYLKNNVITMAQVGETPKLHLVQAFLALHDKNSSGVVDTVSIVSKGMDLALEQWWQLPEMSFQSRILLLQQFQQFVEVQESVKIIEDIANGSKRLSEIPVMHAHGYVELKDILETWRLRTPNEWDDFSVWCDLLLWRNEMYQTVIDAFSNMNHQLYHLSSCEKARSVNMLAHIARKQKLHNVCLTMHEKLYGHSTMDTQEAFFKVREQAKAYLEMKGELTYGLNLINNTDLEQFSLKHKAEMFRLRGDFLLKLSECENANIAYSNAIQIFKHLPKGWISWGNYCDMVYKETNEEVWLEYAASCFLQGIKYGVSNSRSHIAHVLYLLSFDTVNEPVGKAFDKYLDQIPNWVWLSWVPQLLLSLHRSEAPHCKLVLLKIATMYPQALYYWVRTSLTKRPDGTNKTDLGRSSGMGQQQMQQNISSADTRSPGLADENPRVLYTRVSTTADNGQDHQVHPSNGSHDGGSSSGKEHESSMPKKGDIYVGPSQPLQLQASSSALSEAVRCASRHDSVPGCITSTASKYDGARDILDALKNKHPNLASELEMLLTELGSKFLTLPQERLLSAVDALLYRCYKCPAITTEEVPQALRKELSSLCRAFFSAEVKHVDFVKEYKKDFEDLDPDSAATFPATISELIERLKHCIDVIQNNVDRIPAVLKLEEESRVLQDFHGVNVEIPGQYFVDQEVAPDHTVKLDRIGADIAVVRRHGSSYRRLTLFGSDGSKHHFIVQSSAPNAQSDERLLQLFRLMNRMFDKHKESRRRHLYLHAPIIVPVWSQVRLVEDDLMYSTFLEVYEVNCARHDREVDLPITHFKEQLNQAISGQISLEAVVDLRLQAYNDITKDLVGNNMFSQYMYKTLLSIDHMWEFKRQFGIQMALSCFISFMLQIGGRNPHKILFSKSTGKIFQTDFYPAYDANGMIEFNEPVPFRLTRNMHFFFSQFGVEGPIISAMCAAAQALVSPGQSQHIWYDLAMFFRDEMHSWSRRRPLGMPSTPVALGFNSNPLDFMHKVVTNVEHTIDRIKGIAPQHYLEEEDDKMEPAESVQSGVRELVEAALTPRNLCMMDPTWHPWF